MLKLLGFEIHKPQGDESKIGFEARPTVGRDGAMKIVSVSAGEIGYENLRKPTISAYTVEITHPNFGGSRFFNALKYAEDKAWIRNPNLAQLGVRT